jgi:hypothetical protein
MRPGNSVSPHMRSVHLDGIYREIPLCGSKMDLSSARAQ